LHGGSFTHKLSFVQLPELALVNVVVQRYADVVETLRLVPGQQPLVLPTNEWFPDRFTGDQASFEALVARMQGYAGLEETEIEAELQGVAPDAGCGSGGCGSGACATPKTADAIPRLVRLPSGFRVEMPATAVSHPIAFTASVARLLAQIRLANAGDRQADAMRAELAGTALGFGVLLFEGSYLYSKSCGGPSVGSATALSCGELAVPLALFLAYEGHKLRTALPELSTTQRAVIDDAWALVDSNRPLVRELKERPERVKNGSFELREARSWLSRLFSGKKPAAKQDTAALALSALERGESLDNVAALLEKAPAARAPRREKSAASDDVSSLVDEALAEMRAPSGSPAE
jgi:hypothetical protein